MSIRITKTAIDDIIGMATAEAFAVREKALLVQENDLAEACYHSVLPKQQLDLLTERLPKEWTQQCDYYNFTFDNGERFYARYKPKKIFPCVDYHSSFGVIKDKKTNDLAAAYMKEKVSIEESKKQFKIKLRSLLNSFSTYNALYKAWPEGHKFYKNYMVPINKTGLPAVRFQEVNKLLGLNKNG